MDKTKNKKKLLADILSTLTFLLILFSGWIMYVAREIHKDNKETEEINNDTKIISDSIIITQSIGNIDYALEVIDKLERENQRLSDSLRYYSVFYDMVREVHDFEFKSSMEDSCGYLICSYTLINKGAKRLNRASSDKHDSVEIKKMEIKTPFQTHRNKRLIMIYNIEKALHSLGHELLEFSL